MSYLNLMGNKLKPKEVNDALESIPNGTTTPTETSAVDVGYNNATSHLSATNVQSAIDELKTLIPTITTTTVEVTTNENGVATLTLTTSHKIISIYKLRDTNSDVAYCEIEENVNETVFTVYLHNRDGSPYASKTCNLSITYI